MIGDDFVADVSGALNAGLQAVLFDPHQCSQENYEHTEIPEDMVATLPAELSN